MRKYTTLIFLLSLFLLLVNVAQAGTCFPKGKITVQGANGQTYQGDVSAMGEITIDYPYGALKGRVDSSGYFKASNDQVETTGTVDTSCPLNTLTPSSFTLMNPENLETETKDINKYDSSSLPNPICPLPEQPLSQQRDPVDSARFGNGLTINKYSDGIFSVFLPGGYYIKQGSEIMFNEARKAEDLRNRASSLVSEGGHAQEAILLMDIYKTSEKISEIWVYQLMNQWVHDTSCLAKKSKNTISGLSYQKSCPANSTSTLNGSCACAKGFEAIFKISDKEAIIRDFENGDFKCGTHVEAIQAAGVRLYGSHARYNVSDNNFSCEDGYTFEFPVDSEKNKCVLLKNDILVQPSLQRLTKPTSLSNENIKTKDEDSNKIETRKNTEPTATSSENQALKTEDRPIKKHWYQWLNLFSWFR